MQIQIYIPHTKLFYISCQVRCFLSDTSPIIVYSCQDFEDEVKARLWSWSLFSISLLVFCRGYEVESWLRFWTRLWILSLVEMLMFGWNFEVDAWSRFWRWNLIKICVWIRDMTSRSYFGKMNSILGSVVPLAMFFLCTFPLCASAFVFF